MKAITITKTMRKVGILITFLVAMAATHTAQAQTNSQDPRTIKGVISDVKGPLEGVSVILKGKNIGTATNSKGEFVFPEKLKNGDVLVISYLGYTSVDYKISKDTTTINLTLTSEAIEFTGAPNSNKPYKSKREKE